MSSKNKKKEIKNKKNQFLAKMKIKKKLILENNILCSLLKNKVLNWIRNTEKKTKLF